MTDGDRIAEAKVSGGGMSGTGTGTGTGTIEAGGEGAAVPAAPPNPREEIYQALKILTPPGGVFEVRALGDRTASGYFDADHLEDAAKAIEPLDAPGIYHGIYITLNPVNPALLSRRANRIETRLSSKDATTSDADITRRRWFPVAIDLRRYWHEVDVQGTFEHSDNLPEDHRAALQDLFGREQVTAEMQMRRIFQYVFTYGGAFELYTPHILYIAPGIDWTIEHPALGDRPIVMQTAVIEEIRAWWVSGRPRIDWTIKFLAGGQRSYSAPGEEEDDSWWVRMMSWLFGGGSGE